MAKRVSKKASGFAVFCDDIRVELGGKFTLVGVYGSAMLVAGEPPYQIPKFGIYLTYSEASNDSALPLAVEIYVPGDARKKPSHVFEIPAPPREMDPISVMDEGRKIEVQIPIVLAPFNIPLDGTLDVRMRRGSEIIPLGKLLVQKMPMPAGEQAPIY